MNIEGVIKFKCEWERSQPFNGEHIKDINEARQKLYDLKYIGENNDGIGYGNISKRYNDNVFFISGSGTGGIKDINEEHYTIVTEYDINSNFVKCKGPIIASSETMTHAALYHISEEINCVIHIHSLSIWKNNIDILPTTSENIQYGTPEMANEITRLWNEGPVKDKKVIIMGGHEGGIIAFGKDVNEALEVIFSLK